MSRWESLWTRIYGESWSRRKVRAVNCSLSTLAHHFLLYSEEDEDESEEESEEEETTEPAPADGLQTPSGLETPSGINSVVSTVAGGLETPDFLELRKTSGRASSEATDNGPRSLYQVVPEKQTAVRGLMGSERGYDVSAVSGAPIPVLGDERGTKVRASLIPPVIITSSSLHSSTAQSQWR